MKRLQEKKEGLNMKSFKAVVRLSVVSFISLLPMMFLGDNMNLNKIDIYLFSDSLRWPENVAYDISEILTIITLVYTVYDLIPERKYKRYALCFLIASIISAIGYFLFFSKYVSLFLLPILIGMLIYTYYKNDNEKRNNVG